MITAEDMNKDVVINIRLTAEEHKRWLAAATAEDRTLSNWIRRQCNAVTSAEVERAKIREEFINLGSDRKAKSGSKKGGR